MGKSIQLSFLLSRFPDVASMVLCMAIFAMAFFSQAEHRYRPRWHDVFACSSGKYKHLMLIILPPSSQNVKALADARRLLVKFRVLSFSEFLFLLHGSFGQDSVPCQQLTKQQSTVIDRGGRWARARW